MRFAPLLLLAACLTPKPPAQAPTREPVLVATVLESFDEEALGEVPSDALDRVTKELEARNLEPVPADAGALSEFTSVRSTDGRVEALVGQVPVVLLVEAAPRFSAQVNGRYRWSVETTVTLQPGTDPLARKTDSFSVPVHLVYSHEEEPQALSEASPVVARHVARILDEWIAASR